MKVGGNIGEREKEVSLYPTSTIIQSALKAATANELPIAVWRLPNSHLLQVTISTNPAILLDRLDIQETGSGFTFTPFDQEKPGYFINADFQVSIDLKHTNSPLKIENENLGNALVEQFLENLDKPTQQRAQYYKASIDEETTTGSPDYTRLVSKALQGIHDGRFQKVVPARKKEISLGESFDPIQVVLELCNNYPTAFISLVSIPKAGTWIGATPEVLLEVDAEKHFRTVALAATQKRDPFVNLSETAWTQKEIEEQAMVSRYIINCFKKIRLREFEEKGPKTIEAGNLLHLKTEYHVDMVDTNFPQLGTVMLDLLHPTSAVAGMPKKESIDFLKKHEGFDRAFFSGYLGPVNIHDSTNIFVNLRCMQLFTDSALLYAGAGITEDSNPEKEFIETELKFNTLLNIINKGS